jgi:hypothetical protein
MHLRENFTQSVQLEHELDLDWKKVVYGTKLANLNNYGRSTMSQDIFNMDMESAISLRADSTTARFNSHVNQLYPPLPKASFALHHKVDVCMDNFMQPQHQQPQQRQQQQYRYQQQYQQQYQHESQPLPLQPPQQQTQPPQQSYFPQQRTQFQPHP